MGRFITIKVSPELRREICQKADEQGLPMSEVIVRLLAKQLGKPELGIVPRKPMGRPRKELAGAK